MAKEEKLHNIRHTLAHLLAAAVGEIYKFDKVKLTLGPTIENGFYYDIDFGGEKVTDANLKKIEDVMRKKLPKWTDWKHKEISQDEALKFFQNEYKAELINEIAARGEKITTYTSGGFTDLCRGGHVKNPSKEIAPDAFKLDRVAGAYWRGDEKNKMLTRIYGLAFETKEELDVYVKQQEEASKRDHKKIGQGLDLFTFSDLVGAGLPLFTPKGAVLREMLDDFVWELRKKVGYERVDIPHITKKELYEKSGHWEKFKDDLFKINTREGHVFAMKPMNCPHHTQIYNRRQWSYKELPQRYADTTKVYRDEQTGELNGLARVRSITQDDAHVFCRQKDAGEEMGKIYNIVKIFYGSFGFVLKPRLSLHDPKNMKAYLGTEEVWVDSENALRKIIEQNGETTTEVLGEAAFYGPKIDFMAKDAIGREHQVATIQLDMNMPERFDLFCINEKGAQERIVMIHAAIMGSIERFLSILIEHTAGVFPLWLAPVQLKVIPVRSNHNEYAGEVFEMLKENNIRAELDDAEVNLGTKVRSAKNDKIPYWIVIGDKEIEAKKVTLESRDSGNLGQMSQEELLKKILEEIKNKK
ncbi:threonine--tRNA ligase [Candidatus Nomurabacteria bacterium RIFCSPHIGHO2_01_FULL_39_220]|uniref:Threonine--tRNA ligase n=1 Tax=Candidatus Nomurabacteria bacterium RIFCSPLOWO2_02_FULL_40_67 TaxID=1801787 RepID=A0A1F6Y5A0_9BACT|nr:MAG: Threonine-tRNA ligase [Parcubacteria group bacterium GW2011_GWA2_40_37]KKS73061.1 MAG: Threonine-tRNA ligase [Parcubacteria group bacterium GW2011_GWF2_42_7]OGI61689.1 MAG: threonine--tRNA ligase [Candidatus Nomurabacteria bacterium RBG_16_40_11]OGI69952.1 MAG: threonine--tRNA ligase [Candidatus Nomurabacteria bacterium RIFCSPHIGHO2_01_FULL_39_220]OGI73423.1 MAG: threonine--tRNA ligase [Candidatus Nomurabacteria bacterium RIFCSPHIGHO2_02_41_18]OGI78524.1 MAG: threonine--tRNA ligase [Ca